MRRPPNNIEDLIAPAGERVAWVDRYGDVYATIRSEVDGIETREVSDDVELREALCDMTEEHYQLTTTCHQRFRDCLNKWMDYPVVKLVGIVAAIVAATASVWTLIS